MRLTPEWAAAAFAAIAAGIAVWQVRVQVSAERRQAAFAHIRQIASILHRARTFTPQALKQEVIAFYSSEADNLSEEARLYLGFLDSLDLLGLAYEVRAVDRSIIRRYMAGLMKDPYSISEAFVRDFRRVSRDPTVYEHLLGLVKALREA